ncbi:hypothetical protein DLM76_13295 [Leptospira yasudae]|uniref:Uncharacterized protein n=1 Tax=Leptospira yasudae TaxID=2202201 RepID=A0ABX9M3C0_9LEPT|nr:hypothetical protein DLM77_09600 [Leptospira yasudae]RHX93951.1 hypothetical protein DLM76_13295 [Leptospira yasudae]
MEEARTGLSGPSQNVSESRDGFTSYVVRRRIGEEARNLNMPRKRKNVNGEIVENPSTRIDIYQ